MRPQIEYLDTTDQNEEIRQRMNAYQRAFEQKMAEEQKSQPMNDKGKEGA